MKHIDLFSGIGTWALASKEVWSDREMVAFCEIDPFCRNVLKKHFPDVHVYGDIRTLTANSEYSSNTKQSNSYGTIDLLTASPPCQAASSAGKRRGTEDNRWLWPETVRVLGELMPRWAILENVRGILSLEGGVVFDKVLSDVEEQGYEVWPVLLPACGVNAPHQRYRIWIICRRKEDLEDSFSIGSGWRGESRRQVLGGESSEAEAEGSDSETWKGSFTDSNNAGIGASECDSERERSESGEERKNSRPECGGQGCETVADSAGQFGKRELSEGAGNGESEKEAVLRGGDAGLADRREWLRDWREVCHETCLPTSAGVCGMDDADSHKLHQLPDGSTVKCIGLRKERLKALGNGIVGGLAVEIMRAIKHADENN